MGTPELPEFGDCRIEFVVTNLPLKRKLIIEEFEIQPFEDNAEICKRLRKANAESEPTAMGIYWLGHGNSGDSFWDRYFEKSNKLTLLLCFAYECTIDFVRPVHSRFNGSDWEFWGMHSYIPRQGNAAALSCQFNHSQLEEFLARTLPQMLDGEFTKRTGLTLAMSLYQQANAEQIVEMEFLKDWMAIEIMVHRCKIASDPLRPAAQFNPVREMLETQLRARQSQLSIPDDVLDHYIAKLPNLNSRGLEKKIVTFFERAFRNYDAVNVTSQDVRVFFKLRNKIVHQGVVGPEELVWHYEDELDREVRRLRALLELVILAYLDETPQIKEYSLHVWRAG